MEHAWFSAYDLKTRQTTGAPFRVQFNPETYSLSMGNKNEVKREGASTQQQPIYFTFLEKDPASLSLDLLFNTYEYGVPEALLPSVRETYAVLRQFLNVASEKHTPPVLQFAWGDVAFIGVLTHMEENFTMFSSTGRPVRAKVKVTLEGCLKAELKSQALHSPDRTKVRTVRQLETIWAIAAREYDSPELWRPIARANGIRNPRLLRQAADLVIPPLQEGE